MSVLPDPDRLCDECADRPATCLVHVDGRRLAVCADCRDFWANHAVPARSRYQAPDSERPVDSGDEDYDRA